MSEMPLDDLLAELNAGPIPVYAIGLGAGIDRRVLDTIADASRGEAYYAHEVDAVDEIYLDIISSLHSLYRFHYVSRDADRDGRTRTVAVRVRLEGAPEQGEETSYRALRGPYWSFASHPAPDDRIGVVGVSPSGDQVWLMNDGIVINREGEVVADAGIGKIDARHVYGQGPDADAPGDEGWLPAGGTFNSDLAWRSKALSRGERYALLSAWVSQDDYPQSTSNYAFALMDFRSGAIEWVAPLYEGEFNEPGPIAVADDGTALVAQSDVFHIVAADGSVLYCTSRQESGRRYTQVAITSDGSRWVGRLFDRYADSVALSDCNGNELWAVDSEQPENEGGVAISPNGEYVAVNDVWGLRVHNLDGELIYERRIDEFVGGWQLKGVGIANDGSYAYAAGNRVIYGEVE